MQRQFVFVSHASGDKKRLRFVVDALIDGGLKVWLDAPSAMGYSEADIAAHFTDLRGGGRWRDQIDEALVQAMCVLIVWTPASADPSRQVIRDEVAVGRAHKKLIACRIDADFNPGTLDNGLGDEQIVDVSAGKDACGPLVADVRRVIERMSRRALERRENRDPFVPYLIDRVSQETAASMAIREAARGDVKALFVKGPRNECLDQFRERLRSVTSPSSLAGRCSWEEHLVDWPPVDSREAFHAAYEDALARALRVRTADLGDRFSGSTLIAPVSVLHLAEWRTDQRHRVLDWLSYWQGLTRSGRNVRAVPALMVDLPAVAPTWKRVPPTRENGVSAKRVAKDVAWSLKQAQKRDGHVGMSILDTLHPVTEADAQAWRRKVFGSTTDTGFVSIGEKITAAFGGGRRRAKQIALEDFATHVGPYFSSGETTR